MLPSAKVLFAAIILLSNLTAFAAFWFDKRRAEQGGRRIAERTLLGLAFAGGSLGALAAQQILRHKTRKQPFRRRLLGIGLLHLVLLALMAFPALRGAVAEAVNRLI